MIIPIEFKAALLIILVMLTGCEVAQRCKSNQDCNATQFCFNPDSIYNEGYCEDKIETTIWVKDIDGVYRPPNQTKNVTNSTNITEWNITRWNVEREKVIECETEMKIHYLYWYGQYIICWRCKNNESLWEGEFEKGQWFCR